MKVEIDVEQLRPAIEQLVAETLVKLGEAQRNLPEDRECFSEAEAARRMGLNPHQLADERRRGRIPFSRIVGRKIRYRRQDLLSYLMTNRGGPEEGGSR